MNKNMKYIKIKIVLFLSVAGICMTSCTDWLSLRPFDQVLDEEVYGSERNINLALNGLYLNMADRNLFGSKLTYHTVGLLEQRYSFAQGAMISSNIEFTLIPFFNYGRSESAAHLDGIFTKAYNVILDVNYFIDKTEKSKGIIPDAKKNMILGEAYALRAFLHLDMLRFYGYPPISGKDESGVPYCTKVTSEWQPTLEVGEVLALVLKDIDVALNLLKDDPIRTNGVVMSSEEYDFYGLFRNRRMNYFAVQALKMRTLFYSADPESVQAAGVIARELIESEAFQNAFPWVNFANSASVTRNGTIYADEVIFGINVQSLYDDWARMFNTSASSQYSVLPTEFRTLNYMYDSEPYTNTYDRRALHWQPFGMISGFYLTTKFRGSTDNTLFYLYLQPLIRKSEVYLVAAEIFQEDKYVNAIREHRGLKPLDEEFTTYNLQLQIRKEYMKEFVSEGQLFYYYKRRAETNIWGRNGSAITVSVANYMPFLPKSEREK